MSEIKNVILLTIDTFSYKFISNDDQFVNELNLSPFLNQLINENISLSNHFSAGCPTQMSFPSIMTSTLPLDYDGYEFGIKNRPTALAEILSGEGYNTVAFVSGSGTEEFYSYHRGFNDFYSFADLSLTTKSFRRSIEFYKNKELEYVKIRELSNYIKSFLDYCLYYSQTKVSEIKSSSIANSHYLHNWDFNGLIQLIENEKNQFKDDSKSYTIGLIRGHVGRLTKDILAFRRYNRWELRLSKESILKIKLHFLIYQARRKKTSKVGYLFYSVINLLKAIIQSLFINNNHNVFESSHYVLSNALNWLGRQDDKFFLWLHISDLHEDVIYSNINNSSVVENEIKINLELIQKLRKVKTIGNERYKLSLRLNDSIVENFFNHLKTLSLLEDTLVIITSDHGSQSTGLSDRNYFRSNRNLAMGYGNRLHSTDFYDELYHIPAIFVHPRMKKRIIKSMTSSIDIAPTILELLNIDSPEYFKGKSVFDETNRDYVMFENLGPGPADFDFKPIKMAIRSRKFKLVVEEIDNKRLKVAEVYNLLNDPLEEINILNQFEEHDQLDYLYRILMSRYEELRVR